MDDWLESGPRPDRGGDGSRSPAALELGPEQASAILELARIAAHESGERTNAPLVCYLAGLAAGRSESELEDVVDAAAGRRA